MRYITTHLLSACGQLIIIYVQYIEMKGTLQEQSHQITSL